MVAMEINVILAFNNTNSSSADRDLATLAQLASWSLVQGRLKGKQRRKTFEWQQKK